jgi:hypothetical protein
MEAGDSAAEARAAADNNRYAQHFPIGKPFEQHLVYNVDVGDAIVDYLWIGPEDDGDAGGFGMLRSSTSSRAGVTAGTRCFWRTLNEISRRS